MVAPVLDIPDEGLPGEFWIEDGPHARGRLRWDDRGRPSVITDEEIRRSHTIRASTGLNYITIERNDGPREMVADSIPVSVLGTLDDGTAITLRESMLMGGPLPTPQTHLGLSLIVGAHAPSEDALFSCARFSIPHPRTWHSITLSEEAVDLKLGETSARLSVDLTEEDAWIRMAIEGGLPSHEWERRLWYRASVLMSLWVNDEVRPRRVQLQLPRSETWVEQVWRQNQRNASFDWTTSLLPANDLTLQHVAKALEAFEAWGTVAEIASTDAVHGTKLQTAVFLYASALEGFHHHCRPKKKPFPGLSISKTEQVAEAAAQAAVSMAQELKANIGDPGEAKKRILEHFQYFNQPSFNEQLHELMPDIKRVTPGLSGQDEETWVKWVVAARNQEAHRRPKRTQLELLEEAEHLYQLGVSTQWALRVCVLLELGVDGDTLRCKLAEHQRFLIALANMDRSELSWPGSRLDDFLAGVAEQERLAE